MSELKRNIGYVVDLVNERPGGLDYFELTLQTRLRHSRENPLGLNEARDAIAGAEQRGLIEARPRSDSLGTYFYGDKKVYYPQKPREGSVDMLAHYVGTYIIKARMALTGMQNVSEAKSARETLIKKLEGLGEHPSITSCLDYLRANPWESIGNVDSFAREYIRLVPTAEDVGNVVKKLFDRS